MKYNMKTFWLLGLSALFVVACDASTDAEQSEVKVPVAESNQTQQTRQVVMYKAPNCECCTGWADHLRQAGFNVVEKKRDDMSAIKSEYGVSDKLASCHTAIIDGYVIEGHVPAADVERLLSERPNVVGLTAPGMPMKSPGMQAVGKAPKSYDVLAFSKDGTHTIFSHY